MPIDFSSIGSPFWGSGERGLIFALLVGWVLDLFLGDPTWLPHPVVGFGKAISFFEHHLNRGSYRKLKGAVMSLALIAATYAVGLTFNFQLSTLLSSSSVLQVPRSFVRYVQSFTL